MARLTPVPAAHNASPATFVYKDLHNCMHVSLCQYETRRAVDPPYSGPYYVLSRGEKTLELLCGKPVTVSTDRVKRAYLLNKTDCGSTIFNLSASVTPAIAPPATPLPPAATQTTRSLSSRLLPRTLQHLINILRRGGDDVGTSNKGVLLRVRTFGRPAVYPISWEHSSANLYWHSAKRQSVKNVHL
jgi:hypothetical protein